MAALILLGSEFDAPASVVCWRHDSYRAVLARVVAFVTEHERWPLKGFREKSQLAVAVQQVHARQQAPFSKFYGKSLQAYARCLFEEQMVAWESIACGGVFIWNNYMASANFR